MKLLNIKAQCDSICVYEFKIEKKKLSKFENKLNFKQKLCILDDNADILSVKLICLNSEKLKFEQIIDKFKIDVLISKELQKQVIYRERDKIGFGVFGKVFECNYDNKKGKHVIKILN